MAMNSPSQSFKWHAKNLDRRGIANSQNSQIGDCVMDAVCQIQLSGIFLTQFKANEKDDGIKPI